MWVSSAALLGKGAHSCLRYPSQMASLAACIIHSNRDGISCNTCRIKNRPLPSMEIIMEIVLDMAPTLESADYLTAISSINA